MPKTLTGYTGVFLALLSIATITGLALKVFGVITLGWWTIVTPLLVSLGLVVAFVLFVVLIVTYADVAFDEDDEEQ